MTSALAFVRELFHESTLGDVLADAYAKLCRCRLPSRPWPRHPGAA